ncbi:MAG: outer membrane protein assembly factor BamE [Alphaproteobacteria bacterium]|nr:outer membrane protein assembly factor BamE [Alphaproteobacteria bacterium]
MTYQVKRTSLSAFVYLGLFCLLMAACSPVTAQRGNMLEDAQIPKIIVGESTMTDVLQNFGSPTAQSTFDTNIWYYIGQETEKYGILDHEIVEERIVSVTFNKEGIVESIEEIDNERLEIPYANDKTPTHGNDFTFMQQLLGNVGRFNAPGNDNAANTAGGGI